MAVPLHFTIEFLGFLVAAGGAILALTRRSLVPGEAANRVTAAIGFLIFALAQVLHGAAFQIGDLSFAADGGRELVAARAVALAFVFVGVSGGMRAGSSVAAAVSIEQPLLFAPAGAALLVAFSALVGSAKNGPRAYRRLAVGAFLLAISEVFTSIDPTADFGTREVSGYAYIAHGLKMAAFLAMAAWLWSAVRSSVRTRFVASFAALLVMVVLALSTALTGVLTNNVEDEKLTLLEQQLGNVVDEFEGTAQRELKDDVDLASNLQDIKDRVATRRDVQGLTELIQDDLEFLGFDFVMITDSRGRLLGFTGSKPLKRIDAINIAGLKIVFQVVRGSPSAALPSRIGKNIVANVAASRIPDPVQPNRTAGIIVAGRFINHLDTEGISDQLAAVATLMVDGKVVASELPRYLWEEVSIPGDIQTQISALGVPASQRHTLGRRSFFTAYAPVHGGGGSEVATMLLSSAASSIVDTREALTRILFLVAMVVGGIALVLAYFSGRRITRPIQTLTATASAVREGDLTAQAPISGDDEVGRLGETFNEMTSSLLKMTNDLRSAAREEHQLRARIETIIQSMADGLVATDSEHKVLAFNREAELLTGLKARHAIGKPVDQVLQAVDANGEKVTLPIFDLGSGMVDNIFLMKRNKDRVPVAVVSAALTAEEGEVAGGVAVLRDMSREREVERMKSEFLANISHELRTPLTPIKGYAEILGRKEVPPDKVKKFVGGILEGTARLERIIQLLVDFSAMEAGRLAPRNKPIDIGEMVEIVAKEWDARTAGHDVVAEIVKPLPRVSGDERLLRRSLEEVMDNAVKFSPHGGTIRLRAKGVGGTNGERRRRSVEITISDEGIGIPPEDLPKIFSDFHQLDGSETRSFGGLGLGLAFVQRIVEAHNGGVTVESELDRGTALTISIPAAKRPPRGSTAQPDVVEGEPEGAEGAETEEPADAEEATAVAGSEK